MGKELLISGSNMGGVLDVGGLGFKSNLLFFLPVLFVLSKQRESNLLIVNSRARISNKI